MTLANAEGAPFVCSWSGGKDSCLALLEATRAGGRPEWLLCVADETGRRTRSHALPVEFGTPAPGYDIGAGHAVMQDAPIHSPPVAFTETPAGSLTVPDALYARTRIV